jgi:hypothetical protein
MFASMSSSPYPLHALTPTAGTTPMPTSGLSGAGCRRTLRAHLDYDAEGAVLFRLSGQEAGRFARVLSAFRRSVPVADREWVPEMDAWVLFGGWDDELLEILEDHMEPEEVFVNGHPLRTDDAD